MDVHLSSMILSSLVMEPLQEQEQLGFHGDVRDYIKPVNSCSALFSIKQDVLQGSRIGHAYSTVGGGFLALDSDPDTGGNRVALMGIHSRNDNDLLVPFREAMKKGDEALKKYVAHYFKCGGWKTNQVMEAMMDSDDFYANEMVQVKTPTLRKGRFVLVGDTGYAAGLQAYEERNYKRHEKIPPLRIIASQTYWGLWLRNHIVAFTIAWINVVEYAQRFFLGSAGSRLRLG